MKKTQYTLLIEALSSLCSETTWVLKGKTYDDIEWQDERQPRPTKEEVTAEMNRISNLWKNTEYQRLRATEYPPITDYLDAVVKGDLEQQQAYIDACLAVKAKYPKPEGV